MPKKELPASFWIKYLKAYEEDKESLSVELPTMKLLKTLPIWKKDERLKDLPSHWLVARDGVSLEQINDYLVDLIDTIRADSKPK